MDTPEGINDLQNLTLITGGARSGKSAYAEAIARSIDGHVVYIATMTSGGADGESVLRINKHKSRRPGEWQTIEEPVNLAGQISRLPENTHLCLIDCLSLWIANLLPVIDEGQTAQATEREYEQIEKTIAEKCTQLLQEIKGKSKINFVIVTNEVGSGIVPNNLVARLYRDLLGTLNQTVARSAGRVWLCCVGLQISLKDSISVPKNQS